jgi:hypothetical protein
MLRMLMFATVMILSGAALAEDGGGGGDGGGDSDGGGAAAQSTESGPAPDAEGDVAQEENCTGATGCQQKKPRVDFEAWDKSRKTLEKAADDAEKGSGKGSIIP